MQVSQDQANLEAIEVNDQSSGDFYESFFLDLATHNTLKKLFQIYFLFLMIHFIGSCITPQNFERSSKIYSINYDPTIKYVEIDVTLANLQPKNRLVTAYGEVLRKNIQDDETLLLNITSRSMYNYHFVIVNLTDPVNFDAHVNFAKNDRFSSSFLIFNNTVHNYDLVQTRLNIGGDFRNIDGFNFSWTSVNPNPERFLNFAKISFLFFNVYVLIFFVPLRKFKIEVLTQKLLIILLFSSLLASIPATFLLYNHITYLFECLSASAFIAIFRLFCIIQIYISINDESKSLRKFITNLIVVFLFTSIIDSSAHFLRIIEKEKPQDLQFSILTIELINSIINLVISCGIIVYCVSSYRNSQSTNLPRLSITASLLIASSIITIITEIIALFLKLRIQYIWPEMMFLLYHFGTVTLLAFLFRPADSLQYEDIRLNEKQNLNHAPTNSVDLFGDD